MIMLMMMMFKMMMRMIMIMPMMMKTVALYIDHFLYSPHLLLIMLQMVRFIFIFPVSFVLFAFLMTREKRESLEG